MFPTGLLECVEGTQRLRRRGEPEQELADSISSLVEAVVTAECVLAQVSSTRKMGRYLSHVAQNP